MEKILEDNIIIGYYGDKAIVEKEDGAICFFDCPKNLIPIGSVTGAKLKGLDKLDKTMQEEILKSFKEE